METYASELLQKGKRIDGRKFDEFRKIDVVENIIEKAEGSARLRLGKTEVIAGVKLGIATPFADTPDEGILMVNAEFTPLASPEFESGPPSENAVELSRVVDRCIRESKCIELDKLCIVPKEKVWSVYVDIHILNHQGNLLDAAALASIIALHNTQMPKIENDEIVREEFVGKLPVVFKPINISVCKIGKEFLLDPDIEEENALNSRLSIAVREDDKICALQKQGSGTLEFGDIERMIDIAIEKSKELRKLVK